MSQTNTTETALAWARDLHRSADDRIRAVYEKRAPWAAAQTAYQEKVRCAFATVKEDALAFAAWQQLLHHVGPRTRLLAIEPFIPGLGPQPGNTSLDALLQLALWHRNWLRPAEAWQPATHDARGQFGALARHLLVRYDVPVFLDASWFEGFTVAGQQHRNWFVHIGNGQNIRTVPDCPVRLTKGQAHHFLQAPPDVSVVAALRWGQTRGLGGDAFLARAIAASKLESVLPDEPFWASVIHFFVNNARLATGSVSPIVDFVYGQKFGEPAPLGPDGRLNFDDAPEPDFTMKGRTLAALQKRREEWHAQLARETRRPAKAWNASGFEPLYAQERDAHGILNTWTIRELCDSQALQQEGREMRHCVLTYAGGCLQGTTSIWSLRVRPGNDIRTRRLLTIEVNNARRAIVQVRGRCNQTLGAFCGKGRVQTAEALLRRWAGQQRLAIACRW